MIYKLDLPAPSQELIDLIKQEVIKDRIKNDTNIPYEGVWEDQYTASIDLNGAGPVSTDIHRFGPGTSVFTQINAIYLKYLKKPVIPSWITFSNKSNNYKFASLLPHCDIQRTFTINYLIEPGGPNVNTVLYKESRTIADLSVPEFKSYDQLTLVNSYNIPEDSWTMFDVQNYHSVENIETERVIFALVSLDNYDRSVAEVFDRVAHLATPLEPINLKRE